MPLDGTYTPEGNIAVYKASGEVIEYGPIKPKGRRGGDKPKQRTGGRWSRLYDDQLFRLLGLTGTEFRVLVCLIGDSNVDHSFRFATNDIAIRLGVAPPTVSRALRALRAHGILIQVGSSRRWYLDPRIMWRGSDPSREKALTDLSSTLDSERTP